MRDHAVRSLRHLAAPLALLLAACASGTGAGVPPPAAAGRPGAAVAAPASPSDMNAPDMNGPGMNAIAERYVRLVLAVGAHDADYVDAYYGPPAWKNETTKRPLAELRAEADSLRAALQALPASADPPNPDRELLALRHRYLDRQLEAVAAKIDLLGGRKMSFDEESRALYDAVAPTYPEEHFTALTAELERVLPGDGPLPARVEVFRKRYTIPPDRVDAVFRAAIAECRGRTQKHLALPPGESFEVEYVKDQPWSAYNWYKGSFHSLIQVNDGLPILIDRAIDLACHEGYPGHHVYNALLEKHLVRDRGWVELSVYPLFSPQSLIAEGTANFGIEVAFPGDERTEFERRVLYPLAGLDPATADAFAQVQRLTAKLDYAGNEAARRYLDGRIDGAQAAAFLERYALASPERAAQRVKFFDKYRSYVINYNLGRDLVRTYVEAQGGTEDHPDERWQEFGKLISSPRLPSGLR